MLFRLTGYDGKLKIKRAIKPRRAKSVISSISSTIFEIIKYDDLDAGNNAAATKHLHGVKRLRIAVLASSLARPLPFFLFLRVG